MLLGFVLLLAALLLLLHNREEARQAEESVNRLMPLIVESIEEQRQQEILPDPMEEEMPEVLIDGQAYIGYLSIPDLNLDLPILSDWDYEKLLLAPCRYSGTLKGNDLVLMAHNYVQHFARLHELSVGNRLTFTDMDGIVTEYEVVGSDVLPPEAVEEMCAGDFDLTLFTCNYSGSSRITIYCERTE